MNTWAANRLFDLHQSTPLLSADEICDLSAAMTGQTVSADTFKENLVCRNEQKQAMSNNSLLDAGFTYVGQFISHDIVPKTSGGQRRYVTPRLNLDSVYGSLEDWRGDALFDDAGMFKTGANSYDVLRDDSANAQIPELRNDENSIIVQFHRLVQNLHNEIVKRYFTGKDPFERISWGQKITSALFHLVIIRDFLPKLLDDKVYKHYFVYSPSKQYILPLEQSLRAIPIEFSLAAFRFGHSMVLQAYNMRLNRGRKLPLRDLLRSSSVDIDALPIEHQLDWSAFFRGRQKADFVDMFINLGMGSIPQNGNIVAINLHAGQSTGLPSGYSVREYLLRHYQQLSDDIQLWQSPEVKVGSEQELEKAYEILTPHFDNKTLPLWLYVLRESAYSSVPKVRLGKVGSVIVAEVLRQSIRSCYPELLKDTSVDLLEFIAHIANNPVAGRETDINNMSELLTAYNLDS